MLVTRAFLITLILKMVSSQESLLNPICEKIEDVFALCARQDSPVVSRPAHLLQGKKGPQGEKGSKGDPGLRGEGGPPGLVDYATVKTIVKELLREDDMLKKIDLIPKLLYCSLGMMNRDIPDEAVTASSYAFSGFVPQNGRLNNHIMWSNSGEVIQSAEWCPKPNAGEWIQVDLGQSKSVAGVVTQGRTKNQWGENWVKTFKVACGQSVRGLRTITENGSDKIFVGNTDRDSKVVNKFPAAMACRYIRLYPQTWNIAAGDWTGPCMRMELLRGECFDLY